MTQLEEKANPAIKKLIRKDEDQLYKELGMRQKVIAKDPYLMAGFDFDAKYDVVVMGPMDELRRFGEQLFKRYQVEAHKIFCPKEEGDKEDIDNLKKAIGIDDAAVAAVITAAIVASGVGIAPALAAVVAVLIVKRFLRPTYEETCKAWAKYLPPV